jgi:hypothetical protein
MPAVTKSTGLCLRRIVGQRVWDYSCLLDTAGVYLNLSAMGGIYTDEAGLRFWQDLQDNLQMEL